MKLGIMPRRAGVRTEAAILMGYLREAGRRSDEVRLSYMGSFLIGKDEGDVKRRAEEWSRLWQRQGASMDLEQMRRERRFPIGTPAQAVDFLGELEEAGVEEYNLQHVDSGDFGVLELISSKVLPQVA